MDASSRAAFGSGLPGSRSLSRTLHLLPFEAPGQELGLEPDGVVLEDDVVHQQLGQLQVAGRLRAAQSDREERDALPRRKLGGLGQRLALGGLAVGQKHDRRGGRASKLGEDLASGIAQSRLASGRLPPRAASPIAPATWSGRSTSASSRAEFEAR